MSCCSNFPVLAICLLAQRHCDYPVELMCANNMIVTCLVLAVAVHVCVNLFYFTNYR